MAWIGHGFDSFWNSYQCCIAVACHCGHVCHCGERIGWQNFAEAIAAARQRQAGFFEQQGQSQVDIERAMYWDALALKTMMQWRKVHIPIFLIFATLALGHIFSIFLFWGWA
ncbi:MAG: hypothetical protein EBQ70_02515 [Betaproteobacteria bacterium]|nr:hypothetical protein [Betaproteobacteria bacterium]